jgi:hypothetical protein
MIQGNCSFGRPRFIVLFERELLKSETFLVSRRIQKTKRFPDHLPFRPRTNECKENKDCTCFYWVFITSTGPAKKAFVNKSAGTYSAGSKVVYCTGERVALGEFPTHGLFSDVQTASFPVQPWSS